MKTDFYFIARDKVEPTVQAVNRLKAFGATVTKYPPNKDQPKTATRYRVQFQGDTQAYFNLVRLTREINAEYHETSLSVYRVD